MRGTIDEQGESKAAAQWCNNSMDDRNKLPSFGVAFGGRVGLSCQDGTIESRLYYQGMSVQTLESPCSTYSSRSNANQNNAHTVNPLSEFRVASLTQTVPDNFDGLDPPVDPESILDEYVSWKSDKESVDDELFPILCSYLCDESLFSGNESDIREPTPANRSNPDHHLTDLPAELANPQDSQPFAVVNPLNLQQVTNENPANAAEIVDDKSSQVERRKKRKRERERERQRELRKNPAYSERERERQRERRKNSIYLKRQRERCLNNPTYAERRRDSYRKRYQNDPVFAERERERQRGRKRERKREHCQNDPVYAEGQKIYVKTHNRMKKNISKEDASKVAAVAREEYLQSVNYPEDSGDLPQTSNSAETIQNSNNNLDALPFILSQTE